MKVRTVFLVLGGMLLGVIVTVGIVAAGDGEGRKQPTQVGQLTQLEQSGEMHAILERHRQMLEQMQANVSPAMLQLMQNDPMWQMMRSTDWARLDEEHQADLDRMMGKGGS